MRRITNLIDSTVMIYSFKKTQGSKLGAKRALSTHAALFTKRLAKEKEESVPRPVGTCAMVKSYRLMIPLLIGLSMIRLYTDMPCDLDSEGASKSHSQSLAPTSWGVKS